MAIKGALLLIENPKFYCQKVCGNVNFSISEWNEITKNLDDLGISEYEKDKILTPELFPCKTQCEACMNIVLDTMNKNRKILSK